MRMWGINPKFMCRNHLLGEHLEMHMFIGTLQKGKKVDGYVENNLLNPCKIKVRHDNLVAEMKRRGYNHNSPIDETFDVIDTKYISNDGTKIQISYCMAIEFLDEHKIDILSSEKELFKRCSDCYKLKKKGGW